MLKHLDQPNILIQGASRGIGKALQTELVREYPKANVVVTARSLITVDAAQAPTIHALTLDLRSPDSISRCADQIKQLLPTLHLILNVSGLLHLESEGIKPEKRMSELDFKASNAVFQTNCIGPASLLSHLLPIIPKQEPAIIANITARVGSISDNRLGGWYSYRASKAAMNMMTRNLAIELARDRKEACVVALHPGTTDTALSKPFLNNVPKEKLFSTERSAKQLVTIINRLSNKDNGRFIAWDGSDIPW